MTDIQRHLKGICKILQRSIDTGQLDFPTLQHDLRSFLPQSYGIGTGCIAGNDGQSQPVQVLLYDGPLAAGQYSDDTSVFRIEHILCVLDVALSYDAASFRSTVERIASVKRLQTWREREHRPQPDLPPGQTRRTVPKDRLPFALVVFERFEECSAEDERLFDQMHHILSECPQPLWPDQIDVLAQNAQMLNPLLERETPHWYDTSWSRFPDLLKPEVCYACKQKFFRQHFFYERLCMDCGDLNYRKRVQSVDLRGYRVLITGARVKIGYAASLRLLRAGAEVIVTSRFPRDAARRYMQESDFQKWRDHLHIYGLDLRDIPRVEAFTAYLEDTYPYLDAIINNAAQTVKRPPAFYAHLFPFETTPFAELPAAMQPLLKDNANSRAQLFPAKYLASGLDDIFPTGQFDEYGQQIDNRDFNSWVMRLEDIPISELVEVHLVNAIAPAVLAGQLKMLLKRSPHPQRFVINVSAAEGRFAQFKSGFHPHTNMAKAALNMLTRTIADEYAQDGIIVTSVDPGWVSDQTPRSGDLSRRAAAERIPIDMIDAAARVCDPLFMPDLSTSGKLLKDYAVVEW